MEIGCSVCDNELVIAKRCVICYGVRDVSATKLERMDRCAVHMAPMLICGRSEFVCTACKDAGWYSMAGTGGGSDHVNTVTGERRNPSVDRNFLMKEIRVRGVLMTANTESIIIEGLYPSGQAVALSSGCSIIDREEYRRLLDRLRADGTPIGRAIYEYQSVDPPVTTYFHPSKVYVKIDGMVPDIMKLPGKMGIGDVFTHGDIVDFDDAKNNSIYSAVIMIPVFKV